MIIDANLHRIRIGEATAKEARKAIRDLLASETPTATASLYSALRAWTWKALQCRRFDDEMSDWYALLKTTGSAVSGQDLAVSHYLQGLAHLVDDSLRHAAANTHEQLMTRSHLGEILEIVQRHNGRIEREQLAAEAKLSNSRLSQLLSDLVAVGVLDREQDGRKARFILTSSGVEFLDRWMAARRAVEGPAQAAPQVVDPEPFSCLKAVRMDDSELHGVNYALIWKETDKTAGFLKEIFLQRIPDVSRPKRIKKRSKPAPMAPASDTIFEYPVAMLGNQLKEASYDRAEA